MKLYYEDNASQKVPLVLVAGLASDSVSWVFQKGPFGERFRLVTFDNRGVGRSPITPGPYSVKQMSQDLTDVLDDIGLNKVHLLGHSLGGTIAQQFALDHPERVNKLVLACTFSRLAGRAVPVLESWVDALEKGCTALELGRVLFPWLYTEKLFLTPGAFEASVKALEAHPYPMSPVGVSAQLEAIKTFDSRSRLEKLKANTLVLGAEQDMLVSPESCRVLAETIPEATLKILPATGHSCMLETPELFNSAVLEFLDSE
jgi:pimeloyl-ACP methyl ester carboxylesterase